MPSSEEKLSQFNGKNLIICKGNLKKDQLKGDIAIITGSGKGGIGFEAARSLAWLGCKLIIAEINPKTGAEAEVSINSEFGNNTAFFIRTDLTYEKRIRNLSSIVLKRFGKVDIIINNATAVTIGAVKDVALSAWDQSYNIHIRGPVLLIKEFLPGMLQRNKGTIMGVSSSGAAAFMGAYEVFKTAMVELTNTLSQELEGTEVNAFTIGPGLVKTPTAIKSISQIAPRLGQTMEQFFEMSKDILISIEDAGAGFAAAAALASKYKGQETSSRAALKDAGIDIEEENKIIEKLNISIEESLKNKAVLEAFDNAKNLSSSAFETLSNLNESWNKMNNFIRQWVMRDFKKQTGQSIVEMKSSLSDLKKAVSNVDIVTVKQLKNIARKLASYYASYYKQVDGYIKDQKLREEQTVLIKSWQDEAENLVRVLEKI